MAIAHVCDRCGNTTTGHKVYFGKYVAIDTLWSSNASSGWYRKKKNICFKCQQELENWMDNKGSFNHT